MASKLDIQVVQDFIEETEALIDADDGTLFPLKYLNKFEDFKDVWQGIVADEKARERR